MSASIEIPEMETKKPAYSPKTGIGGVFSSAARPSAEGLPKADPYALRPRVTPGLLLSKNTWGLINGRNYTFALFHVNNFNFFLLSLVVIGTVRMITNNKWRPIGPPRIADRVLASGGNSFQVSWYANTGTSMRASVSCG